ETFSLSFYDGEYRDKLSYLGKVSGRDEDKIAKSGLTLVHQEGTPYFAEAKLALICKKMFAQPYQPENFLDPAIAERCYAEKDYHTLYIAEILDILESN
ncbi:MAG: flavin reductase family protein, partial [Angelakisella sp.]